MASPLVFHDTCFVIDRDEPRTIEELAGAFKMTSRNMQRRITFLKNLGFVKYIVDDANVITKISLVDTIQNTYDQLDVAVGVRPHHKPSTLEPEEQQEVLGVYREVLSGERKKWPNGFFTKKDHKIERLRVVLPYAVDEIIKLPFKFMDWRDFDKAKLKNIKKNFGNKYHSMLQVSYQWLKPWELGRTSNGYWSGPQGIPHAKKAITWLVEEIKDYELHEIPEKICFEDFRDNGLAGMLNVLFNGCIFPAIDCAYSGIFNQGQFYGNNNKYKTEEGQEYARQQIRNLVEKELRIPLDEVPNRIRTRNFDKITGIFNSRVLGLKGSAPLAIMFAYPGKFDIGEFDEYNQQFKFETGKTYAQEKIRELVEETLRIPLERVPIEIRPHHFRNNGLRGLLHSKFLDLKGSSELAIMFAYPGRYQKEEFVYAKK